MIQCTCADGSLWKPALSQALLHYLTFISSLSLPCHALVDPPSPSVSAVVEGKDGSVMHVYGSDGSPIGWCIHVSLFYKAATPFHFMPPEPAPLSHPVLCLSVVSVEV